ncbi:hypothetical protein SKAU_G00023430 [Synaphobranchus kaupii]|uniref:Uncharacterized protein n=1 Tax=Synaphobranchus kaupii TaxID=118154 RepID=A0A9Q1GDK4_SYNKA|nr:hypothetical protein SKAU_G00023430 [Synaphobranchus kaupii]
MIGSESLPDIDCFIPVSKMRGLCVIQKLEEFSLDYSWTAADRFGSTPLTPTLPNPIPNDSRGSGASFYKNPRAARTPQNLSRSSTVPGITLQ